MKKQLLRILAVFMALNVLFSSTGLAFYEHTCHISLESTVSLVHEDECCGVESYTVDSDFEGHQLKQGDCCHTEVEHKQLDINSDFQIKKNLKAKKLTAHTQTVFGSFQFLKKSEVVFTNLQRPPPQWGLKFTVLYQQFRI
ncbi:HYC_CC_PP family protein [Jiulongibacter sp. NS-SX5]|uniref:HYC_CC_PP family protein n=1 Tax=Jiulongibacter sp. NS-SX5 TaxID=3463854 RepID=UPI004058F0B8